MATGQDEDALLGLDTDDHAVIKVLLPSLQGIQQTMSSVATGIEKMGEAWAAFAKNPPPTPQAATGCGVLQSSGSGCSTSQGATGTKRPYDDVEGDDEELDYEDDYDDTSDVNSLLGAANKTPADPEKVDEEDVLDGIHASLNIDADVGADTNDKLASIANNAFSKPLATEAVKSKIEAYPRPSNCEKLVVPKVNAEIWKRMKTNVLVKKRDLRVINIQKAITKSACAMTQIANTLLTLEKSSAKNSMMRQATDAIFLLGHANTNLSLQRRQLLRPVLKGDHALCDNSVPITDFLFGDDLPKTLKEIRQSNVGYRQNTSSKNWKQGRSQHSAQYNQYSQNNQNSQYNKGKKFFPKKKQ